MMVRGRGWGEVSDSQICTRLLLMALGHLGPDLRTLYSGR